MPMFGGPRTTTMPLQSSVSVGGAPRRAAPWESAMSAPILVTGGTGTLGRLLVPRLKAAGQRVRVLSRSSDVQTDADEVAAGDLATGAGLDAALAGIEVVLHCAGSAKGDAVKAQHLIDAARRAGSVRHIVYISVVGAGAVPIESGMDRMMFGYYEEKGAEIGRASCR